MEIEIFYTNFVIIFRFSHLPLGLNAYRHCYYETKIRQNTYWCMTMLMGGGESGTSFFGDFVNLFDFSPSGIGSDWGKLNKI